MKGYVWTGLVVVLVVTLFSVAIFGGGDQNSFESVTQQSRSPDNVEPIGPAPNFARTDIRGESFDLNDFVGEKPVILDFWASWCPNCRRDMPNLSVLYEKYKDQVEVVAINLRESSDVAIDFIDSKGYNFTTILDPDGAIAILYQVRFTNYHVLIDKNGDIVNTFSGDISERHFEQLIVAE